MRAFAQATVQIMTIDDLNVCWALDQRCFEDGEAYDRETFKYLLESKQTSALKLNTSGGGMGGFVVSMVEPDNTGHIITLGVAPECRRRGYARWLMCEVERALAKRNVNLVRLEVRVTNHAAIKLYEGLGYTRVERLPIYYTNGDDGYLMVKGLEPPEIRKSR
ncbi:MAG TPA: N-acetyltransferase [Blastocatellia bacterium]|nr:N-acetyltransferase [Blastocatellia bacterium]